jgi:hypothetical protein
MHRIPKLRLRPIEKHVDARYVPVNEAGRGQRSGRGLQVDAPKQQINILGVSHRRRIHRGNPCCNRVAPGYGISDTSPFQGSGRAQQSFPHPLHGMHHPVQKRFIGPSWHRIHYSGSRDSAPLVGGIDSAICCLRAFLITSKAESPPRKTPSKAPAQFVVHYSISKTVTG